MSGYLIDTDWIIDVLNGSEVARRVIDSLDDEVAISIVSCAELYEGVATSDTNDARREDLDRFVADTNVIGIDDDTARTFGDLRSKLRAMGQLIGDMDLFIAATALRWNMTLVTRDHHFDRIEGLRLVAT